MAGEKSETCDSPSSILQIAPVTPLLCTDEKSSDHELSPMTDTVPPPDGGWGWMVVLGSFLAHLIIGGFMRSGGVIFIELQHKFHQSASDTAWAVSLHTSLRLLFGPLASMLCNRFSCRTVTIMGSLMSAVSVLISGFVNNLFILYLTNGLLLGIGQALIYTTSVAIVGLYFHARRGTAVGIANAGVGAGTFLFPPLLEIMFGQYGFMGTFLIMAGLFLNGVVCGALYRPLHVEDDELVVEYSKQQHGGHNVTDSGSVVLVHFSREDLRALSHSSLCYDINILGSLQHLNKPAKVNVIPVPARPLGSSYDAMSHHGRVRADSDSCSPRAKPLLGSDFDMTKERIRSGSDMTPIKKQAFINSMNAKSAMLQVTDVKRCESDTLSKTETDDESEEDKKEKKMLDLSPLKNIRFATLGVGIGLLTLSFQSSFVFLPPLVLQRGLSESQGAFLVSITGAMETFGSVTSGFLVDLDIVRPHRLTIYNAAMVLLGVLTLVMPFLDFFILLAFVCGVYGCVLGMCLAQKATLVVDITGVDNLVSSFGILVCFQGIGTLIGPPLAGAIKDITGRYQDGFLVGGVILVCAGLIQAGGLLYHRLSHSRQDKDS
ncbi:monocarboxylate transporter 12-like [Ylistrum balloti]|uniref:monocarboxylate transporter 12-like n=1 Tax=Ylistrum balloti TaxID=509963 RepID=UPI002905EDE6|nr:monocarboxylate transporter 12-like [Ylistrum balloti]XP_060073528.1 monocarboxylate transporter 12-like [Ylistrum balloti]XP_060073529.1 monocarboxylate transporter 12-like [Ylistrum balloti]XP_060073530.1 monocarboxylate transporter 12-like [Ylistrum balloti]